jgi:hypothetical protein
MSPEPVRGAGSTHAAPPVFACGYQFPTFRHQQRVANRDVPEAWHCCAMFGYAGHDLGRVSTIGLLKDERQDN